MMPSFQSTVWELAYLSVYKSTSTISTAVTIRPNATTNIHEMCHVSYTKQLRVIKRALVDSFEVIEILVNIGGELSIMYVPLLCEAF